MHRALSASIFDMFMSTKKPATLALEDGTILRGRAFGAQKTVTGELVFNTSFTGHQEILSDPSYHRQIVTLTSPMVGNYGTTPYDNESSRCGAFGLVIRELSPVHSNWRANASIEDYMKLRGIPGIEGVDTRAITSKIRDNGAIKACLSTEEISEEEALKLAREWPGLEHHDCVKEVSCDKAQAYHASDEECAPFTVKGTTLRSQKPNCPKRYRLAAMDFGIKTSILRKLAYYGFDITLFPGTAPAEQIREFAPDAVFLSNGPGDPSAVPYVHKAVASLMKDYPMFGICLGNQMIAHALGAQTFKLKFGHRGGNHPVKNLETGIVSITAQNHGFAIDPKSLEGRGGIVTEINLNDGTVEGIRHKDLPIFAVQYHPEAEPGPNDSEPLFEKFYHLVQKIRG